MPASISSMASSRAQPFFWLRDDARETQPRWFPAALHLLDLYQKSLKFRRIRVRIDHRRRECIRKRLCRPAFIFRNAAEPPVNGDSDLESFFAVDLHRLDSPRHHRLRDVMTARAGHFDFLS